MIFSNIYLGSMLSNLSIRDNIALWINFSLFSANKCSAVTEWMSPLYGTLALNLETASKNDHPWGGVTRYFKCIDSTSSSRERWRGPSRFPRSNGPLHALTWTSRFPAPRTPSRNDAISESLSVEA